MMAAALALIHFKDTARSIYLFDTYEGMTPPTQTDKRVGLNLMASAMLAGAPRSHHLWGASPIEEVKTNLGSTGYPAEKLHFIKGPVEHTIPDHAPDQICLLRLDTDWYESTRHELVHLYPRLHMGGVLILDDYGWWEGQRKAAGSPSRLSWDAAAQPGFQLASNREITPVLQSPQIAPYRKPMTWSCRRRLFHRRPFCEKHSALSSRVVCCCFSTHGVHPLHRGPFDCWRRTADGLTCELERSGFVVKKINLLTARPRAVLFWLSPARSICRADAFNDYRWGSFESYMP
jgi:hypothetical protein